MLDGAYTVKYLETFRQQLDEVVDYIAFELENTIAAERLLQDVEAVIARASKAPLITKPYATDEATGDIYYRLNIRNFSVFYVVTGSVMEVRWFRYARRQILVGAGRT